jgi:polygalacturonase
MMAVDPLNVRVTDFGAIGDNSHDDGPAIREAHDYCSTHEPGFYLPLHFPIGRYRIDSAGAIPLVSGMHWTGEGHVNDEKEYRSQIRYSKSHFFELGGTREFAAFTGLCFDGRSQPYSLIADGQLNYSTFDKCGFKNFNYVFNTPMLGCKIINNFFQNNLCTGRFSGSDSIIENNYISGSNYNPGSGNSISADGHPFAVEFGSFTLNHFAKNFITGRPQMIMKIDGDVDGTIFDANWIDIADMSGIYAENSSGGIFVNNRFNRCCIGQDPDARESFGTTDPEYDAIVRMKNCHSMGFWNNRFGFVHGLPAGDPVTSFHLTQCDNIQIANNLFVTPYERLHEVD